MAFIDNPTVKIIKDIPKVYCYRDSAIINTTISDSNVKILWSTGDTSGKIVVKASGVYKVSVKNTNGCTGDDSIKVTFSQPINPTIIPNGPIEFCEGDSVTLTGEPYGNGYFCQWSNGSKSKSIVVKNSNTFTYTVINKDGCMDTISLAVKVTNGLEARISGNSSICSEDSNLLMAQPYGTGYKYLWSTGETNPAIYVSKPGNYWVIITLNSNCLDSANIDITESQKPVATISASGPVQFCKGDSVVLKAIPFSNKNTYHWSTGENTDSITVKSTGNYILIVTNQSGCTDTASLIVLATEQPEFKIQVNGKTKICEGDSVILSVSPTVTGYQYLWNTNETTPSIVISKAGRYIVKVSLNNNCYNTDSIDIYVNNKIIVNISGDTILCADSSNNLSVPNIFQSYLWSTGDTTKSIKVTTEGNYRVTVTDTNGCTGTASIDVKSFVANITGLKDVNFGSVSVGGQTGVSVLLKNLSNAAVKIQNIKTKDSSPEFILKTVPSLPSILSTGETIEIKVNFNPDVIKSYLDSVIIEISEPCPVIYKFELKGASSDSIEITYKTTIWLPDTLALVGDIDYCIPLYARNDDTTKINQVLDFTAEIRYDATALLPDADFPVIAGERVIGLKGSNIKLQNKDNELENICGKIFLPDQDKTILKITSFEWGNPKIVKTINNGSLTVKGLCQQPIARIRMFIPLTLKISPNPVESDLTIIIPKEYQTEMIKIFSVEGILVYQTSDIFKMSDVAAKIDVSNFARGVYYIKVLDSVCRFVKI